MLWVRGLHGEYFTSTWVIVGVVGVVALFAIVVASTAMLLEDSTSLSLFDPSAVAVVGVVVVCGVLAMYTFSMCPNPPGLFIPVPMRRVM